MASENFSNVEDAVVVETVEPVKGPSVIDLTDKQLTILSDYANQKTYLENEYKKLAQVQENFVVGIVEAKGISLTSATKIDLKDKQLVIS